MIDFFAKNGICKTIKKQNPLQIDFLVLWLGTKCSLRCRDCGNLIPYSHDPVSFDMDMIIADMKKLSKVSSIRKMQIQGGNHL